MLLQFIPGLLNRIILYLTYYLNDTLSSGGAQTFLGFKWILEVNSRFRYISLYLLPEQFISQPWYYVLLDALPKHIVISLDILYLISFLMLIFYHTFKQPDYSPLEIISSL